MFNLGFSEIFLLSVIALVVIGPKQLPEVARTIGRMINEFKRATGDLSKSVVKSQNVVGDIINETQEKIKKDIGVDDVKESLNSISRSSLKKPEKEKESKKEDVAPNKEVEEKSFTKNKRVVPQIEKSESTSDE